VLTLALVAAPAAAAVDRAAGAGDAAEPAAPPKLLGRSEAAALREAPFASWFAEGHDAYVPDPAVLDELRRTDRDGVAVTIFLGTWCGDSRREVPRMLALLDGLGLDAHDVTLIGVDNAEDAIKRSPGGEERGLEIWRVPTFVVMRDGTEIGRIVEHPVTSLERDLLEVLAGRAYRPSYRAYPVLRRWLAEGLLSDPNVSPRGLAAELRPLVDGEGDVDAVARVLASRGQAAEATLLYRINVALYPESVDRRVRLARALRAAGDLEGAREAAERALRLNRDPGRTEELVALLAAPEAD